MKRFALALAAVLAMSVAAPGVAAADDPSQYDPNNCYGQIRETLTIPEECDELVLAWLTGLMVNKQAQDAQLASERAAHQEARAELDATILRTRAVVARKDATIQRLRATIRDLRSR